MWGYSALKTGLAYLPFVPVLLAATVVAQQGVTRIGARPLLAVIIALAVIRVRRQDPSGADLMSPTGGASSPSRA